MSHKSLRTRLGRSNGYEAPFPRVSEGPDVWSDRSAVDMNYLEALVSTGSYASSRGAPYEDVFHLSNLETL